MSKWNQTMGGGPDIFYTSPQDIVDNGKILIGRPNKVTVSKFDETTGQYDNVWEEKTAIIRKLKYGGRVAIIDGEAYQADELFQVRMGGPWCGKIEFPHKHIDCR